MGTGRDTTSNAPQAGVTEVAPERNAEDEGRRYRFEHPSLGVILKDMYFAKSDPGAGDRVLAFDLPLLGGERFRSADLADAGLALVIFGSATCPVTDSAAPGLKELHSRFGDQVRFVMVSVREAHPGVAVRQPQTLDVKTAHAERLRDMHGFRFDVAVDDMDGTFHRALSPKPNSAYLVGNDGTILFRALWANDIGGLADALEAVVAGGTPPRVESAGLIRPMLRMLRSVAPVLDRAGRGAWRDMWLVAPPLAFMAFAFKTLGIGPAEASPKA